MGKRKDKLELQIALIPSTSFYTNLRKMLKRADWDKIRRACYKKADNHCEICGGQGSKHPVECHETWEFNHRTGVQKLTGVVALCPSCHQATHFGLAQVRGFEKNARDHIKKVNGYTDRTVDDMVTSAFKLWEIRSEDTWSIDVKWATKQGFEVKNPKVEE